MSPSVSRRFGAAPNGRIDEPVRLARRDEHLAPALDPERGEIDRPVMEVRQDHPDLVDGRVRFEEGAVVEGGAALQPVLYALAAEKLFPDLAVVEGRLSYCTAAGGFEVRGVPLDDAARKSARTLADAVEAGLQGGFLPALPAKGACDFCDFRVVCGPYEEQRTKRKPKAELARLEEVRKLR